MKPVNFIAIALVLASFGCGQSPAVQSVHADRKDPTDLQISAAKNGSLTCDFKDECEPAVSMVSVATGEGVSRCTGFLISDHEVMTNDHCLETIRAGENCEGLVFFHFSENVHRACKNISIRSNQTGIHSKDYAVMELDAPVKDRSPLRLSKRGFNDREQATIFTVQATKNPITHTLDGKQVRLDCQASFSTILDINIGSSKEPIMTFGDCAIHEGNSGSPVFNQSGEVASVIQGYLSVNDDSFYEQIQPFLLDGSYGQVALGTQTRCMPELVGSVGNYCSSVKAISALYPREYLDSFGGFSERNLPEVHRDMIWLSLKSTKPSVKTFVSCPDCISRLDSLRNKFSFTSTVMSYRQGINSRLQAEWRPVWLHGEKQTMFVIQKAQNEMPISVDFVSEEFGKITVPVCK